jgi:hypothetical protein
VLLSVRKWDGQQLDAAEDRHFRICFGDGSVSTLAQTLGLHNTTLAEATNLGRFHHIYRRWRASHSDGTEQQPITDLDLENNLFGTDNLLVRSLGSNVLPKPKMSVSLNAIYRHDALGSCWCRL